MNLYEMGVDKINRTPEADLIPGWMYLLWRKGAKFVVLNVQADMICIYRGGEKNKFPLYRKQDGNWVLSSIKEYERWVKMINSHPKQLELFERNRDADKSNNGS